MCSATLYELKIMKKNGSGGFDVVRHYLPCLKNGRAALYDKANGKICFSDSGTDFVAGNVLPTPSELVEWIESLNAASGDGTGSYIIDTRVYAKSGIKSAVDCMIRSGFTTDQAILACRWAGGSDTRFFLAYFYNSYFGYGYKTGYWPQNVPVQNNKDYRYLIESDLSVGHQSVKVNGTELHKDGDAHDNEFFSPRTTLSLFSLHTGNNDSYPARSNIRLFATKIWDGDEILRDFVPCVDSLGQAGLYDRVTERVFKSPTAYSFETQVGVCTNWLSATPGTRPDRRIDYIESNGTNDYIDVGVMAKDGVEMETVMEWVTVPSDGAFVGAKTDTLTNDAEKVGVRFFPYHHWNDHDSGHRIGYNGQLPGNSGVATAGTKYRIKSHLDVGDQWYTVETFQNGNWSAPVRVERAYANPVDTGLPLYLFAVNFDGVPRYLGQSRVYKLKFWEKQPNGSYKLTREFVPCMKDGKAMLWDRVSETFFRNRGRYLISGGGNERNGGTRLVHQILRLDGIHRCFGGMDIGIAQMGGNRVRIERGGHHQKPQIRTQRTAHVERHRKAQVAGKRTLMELVENHQSHVGQLGIVQKPLREQAFRDDLQARAGRHAPFEAHGIAHGFANRFAPTPRNEGGAGAGGQATRLQHQYLAARKERQIQ